MKTENELANTLRFKEKTAHFPNAKGIPLGRDALPKESFGLA